MFPTSIISFNQLSTSQISSYLSSLLHALPINQCKIQLVIKYTTPFKEKDLYIKSILSTVLSNPSIIHSKIVFLLNNFEEYYTIEVDHITLLDGYLKVTWLKENTIDLQNEIKQFENYAKLKIKMRE